MKRAPTTMHLGALTAVLALVMTLAAAAPADAIPAFARKYASSCQTCHVAYPKLNSFGKAFRLLGYRMPDETEEQVKQPPTSLGAEAYKRVWPDAVWPGGIPSHVPLAISAEFQVENSHELDNDFQFPTVVELVAAGTAGENVSYFGELAFEQEAGHDSVETEVAVEHIDFRFIRPIKSSLAFNVKIGAFQPELVSTFDHARRLTVANYDSMFGVGTLAAGGASEVGGGGHHGGGNGIALPAVATGVELYGVVEERFLWSAGLVNGLGPGEDAFDGNETKDVYGRVAYKWGGIALDGSNADTYVQSAKSWRERSFQVGVFAYQGDGDDVPASLVEEEEEEGAHGELQAVTSGLTAVFLPHSEPVAIEDEEFTRYGLDFNAFWGDFNLFGAYVDGEDDIRPLLQSTHGHGLQEGDLETFSYDAWFLELDAVLGWPWLHGAVRYETVDLPGESHGEPAEDFERATVAVIGLVRANVKSTLEYTWDLNRSSDYSLWLNFGIAF